MNRVLHAHGALQAVVERERRGLDLLVHHEVLIEPRTGIDARAIVHTFARDQVDQLVGGGDNGVVVDATDRDLEQLTPIPRRQHHALHGLHGLDGRALGARAKLRAVALLSEGAGMRCVAQERVHGAHESGLAGAQIRR